MRLVATLALLSSLAWAFPQAPVEEKNFESLTSYAEMMTYLTRYADSGLAQLDTLGFSVEGRLIPSLLLGQPMPPDRREKPLVLLYCHQHGDEPSGKEAALLLLRELAESRELMDRIDLLLVPQVNPDGGEAGTRENAQNVDLNRDHVILSAPESQALHRLFLKHLPDVTLDVHEYFPFSESWISHGVIKDADVMVGECTNPNIDGEILDLAADLVECIGGDIRNAGYSFSRYVVGSPGEGSRFRYSTTDINDGRNSMGLYNTVSFIQEGKQYGGLTDNLELRTRSQASGMLALLRAVADRADTIMAVVRRTRTRIIRGDYTWSHVQFDYFPDAARPTITLAVFDLYQWRRVEREFTGFEPLVRPKVSVTSATAYFVEPGHERILDVLSRHGVKMHTVDVPESVRAEEYLIVNVTPMEEEELTVLNVDAHAHAVRIAMRPGATVVPLSQPAGRVLPLLLEPRSTRGLLSAYAAGEEHFGAYLVPGGIYPIRRIMDR